MTTLWYALFQGELCRIRRRSGGLVCEAWRAGCWELGPNFAEIDFKGRMIMEDEAQAWIRRRFRHKRTFTNRKLKGSGKGGPSRRGDSEDR